MSTSTTDPDARPLVRVWWWDHCDPPGHVWWDDDDLVGVGPVLAVTVGWVVKDDADCLAITSTLCEDGFQRPVVIVPAAILRRETLTPACSWCDEPASDE